MADLRIPSRAGPHPAAVVIHGGFWRQAFSRATTAAVAVAMTRAGWVTWNVEYRRLGSGGGVPETLDDVAAATDALLAVDDPPIDPSRVISLGHSTGGQLSLWLAGTGRVAAAVALAGVCDLAEAARSQLGGGAATEFVGGGPDDCPEGYDAADPMRRLPAGVHQLLLHGDADDRVPIAESRRYREAARRAADSCELIAVPEGDHFNVIDPRSEAWASIAPRLEALARKLT